ncbi:hypothetical protein P692DRAFT_201804167 [Suillus brevipes Sb2]|nr:hypothetical protein P692DRAFT_201804167 [Suillus brevipes Sb2]
MSSPIIRQHSTKPKIFGPVSNNTLLYRRLPHSDNSRHLDRPIILSRLLIPLSSGFRGVRIAQVKRWGGGIDVLLPVLLFEGILAPGGNDTVSQDLTHVLIPYFLNRITTGLYNHSPRAASRTPAKNCSTTKKLKYTFDDMDEENNTSTPLKRKLSVVSDASLTLTE